MTLLDEVMALGCKPIPPPVRTYRPARLRRLVRRVGARVAYRAWEIYAASCIAAVSAVIVAGLAWWIYEELT